MSERQLPIVGEGPFYGMMANSRADAPPGFALYLENMYVEDGEFVGRKGLVKTTGQLASGADIQGIYQWEMLDGTQYTCAFAGGDLHVYDWGADSWTTYDLSAEGLTVSTTGDINCCTSRGRLVGTDGVNKPFMITGELGGVGESFTELASAPVAHRCGVYYDKVFFWDIPGYENEFQWSDEGDPTSGYAGSNQAWEFAQTDAGRILGMAPLNERMDILKEDSATLLLGAVDENFQTLAVREGLSETEGTVAGGSVLIYQGDVYCLSANGPRVIRQGQAYQSIHEDLQRGIDYLRDIWEDVDRAEWASSIGWVDKTEGHLGWLVPFSGDSGVLHKAIVYNAREPGWSIFDFDGFDLTAVGSVEDTSGNEWVMFGDTDGYVYKYRSGYAQWDDDTTAITNICRGRLLGGDAPTLQKRLVELHFQLYLTTDFEGWTKVNVDGTVGHERAFGLHDYVGKKRYRRGCNQMGYRLGWEIGNDKNDQTFTLTKVLAFMSAVGMHGDWNG